MSDGHRCLAAHQILLPDGTAITLGAIEIAEGVVVKWYPLAGEQARTEWMGGTIEIRKEGESLIAYKNNKPI